MKTIGLIGGIGPESTIEYYRLLLAGHRARVPDGSYPSIVINSIDLTRMIGLIGRGELEGVTDYLAAEIEKLAAAGADVAALAANTPHIVFDELRARSPIPMVSIVEATVQEAVARGIARAGIFGTRFTMQGRFYPDGLARHGITLVVPDDEEQAYIHDKYMTELVAGRLVPETRDRLLAIAERLREREGIEALILGGTELPMILRDAPRPPVPLLDTGAIHVESLLAAVLGPTEAPR